MKLTGTGAEVTVVDDDYSPSELTARKRGWWFSRSSIKPRTSGLEIVLVQCIGSRDAWCRSNVEITCRGFVAIAVRFGHRYGGGNQWYFYNVTASGFLRRTWRQLTPEQQHLVASHVAAHPERRLPSIGCIKDRRSDNPNQAEPAQAT